MIKAGRKFFCLALLVATVYFLGTLRNTGHATVSATVLPDTVQASTTSTVGAQADSSGVIFISHDQVSQTYAKGALLYDGNPERNYRVHVFHRDTPGEVEVHKSDTDVFLILEGSATLVTGGTVATPKETAPGEIRAASMDGGSIRAVTKGDVIIIPANVTHWFKEVQQPITYFAVKVR